MTSSSAGGVVSGALLNSTSDRPEDESDAADAGRASARSTAKRAYLESSKKRPASMGLSFLCVLIIPRVAGDVVFIWIDCR
jgi:hypothetical protein